MINVLQIGLGPIGLQTIRYITERSGVKLVAGIDIDPQKAGKSINDLCEFDAPAVPVYSSVAEAVKNVQADVAILTTVSNVEQIESQIAAIAEQKLDIVSTCEELTYPWQTAPVIARRIDECCKEFEVSCLATGVNPGFLMDYLPAVLTSVCQQVEHIYVDRIQDAAPRRGPFRNKIGVGLSPEEFEQKRSSISHVGLPESVGMIAAAMGWELDRLEESLEPVITNRHIKVGDVAVLPAKNSGVEQIATGYRGEQEVIKLVFRAAVGEAEPRDSVRIKGQPSFTSTIPGGVNGDIATAAITVNAICSVQKAHPGLKTMLDVIAPAYFG